MIDRSRHGGPVATARRLRRRDESWDGRGIRTATGIGGTSPADAGLQVGEVRALGWGDFDLVARRMIVQRTDYRGYVGSPKGGRVRSVPLTNRSAKAVNAVRHLKGESVFSNAGGVK